MRQENDIGSVGPGKGVHIAISNSGHRKSHCHLSRNPRMVRGQGIQIYGEMDSVSTTLRKEYA